MRLWIVESPDGDYEEFDSAVVWAGSAVEAKRLVREATTEPFLPAGRTLKAHLAPTSGMVHIAVRGA